MSYNTATIKNLVRAHHILARAGVKGILWGEGSLPYGSKKEIEIICTNRKGITLPYKTWEKVSSGYTADFKFLPFHIDRLSIPSGLYVCPQLMNAYFGGFRKRLLKTLQEVRLRPCYLIILPSIREWKGHFEPLENAGMKHLALNVDVTGQWFKNQADFSDFTSRRTRHLSYIHGSCYISCEKRDISEWRVGPIYPELLKNLAKI